MLLFLISPHTQQRLVITVRCCIMTLLQCTAECRLAGSGIHSNSSVVSVYCFQFSVFHNPLTANALQHLSNNQCAPQSAQWCSWKIKQTKCSKQLLLAAPGAELWKSLGSWNSWKCPHQINAKNTKTGSSYDVKLEVYWKSSYWIFIGLLLISIRALVREVMALV
jgi:hypothetical protein